jgi:REP element-mobilizing transposase RayT
MPAVGAASIRRRWKAKSLRPSPGYSDIQWQRQCDRNVFLECEALLDTAPVVRWLAKPRLAAVVRDALLFGHGRRYELLAYVVMPSHMHVVFSTLGGPQIAGARASTSRQMVIQSLKRFTSRQCNLLLGRSGAFWQSESYDRVVRGADELERVMRYVERNPVKAGLCAAPADWPYSSAHSLGMRRSDLE